MNTKTKKIFLLVFIFLIIVNSFPQQVDAHRAYFMQILIDEGQLVYVSNVMKESPVREKKKTEYELWNYNGTPTTDYESLEKSDTEEHNFTFPSKALKGIVRAKNNATRRDEARAYQISDTLVPNLNEILLIANNEKVFESVDELISKSEEVMSAYNSNGSISMKGGQIKFSGDYATVTTGNDSFDYLVRMDKGYTKTTIKDGEKDSIDSPLYSEHSGEYDSKKDSISIADIITQANYTYRVKGHSSADLLEYAKPGTIEIKVMEFFSSVVASLRSLLGLRDLDELIYNKGIIGSSQYYKGLMPTSWYQKSISFHAIFQALTWLALSIAIIKLALQRNLATISASSRISLMDGIKDLIISGFMLIGVFLLINLLASFNEVIVNVFAETAPDYSAFSGEGIEIASFGGVLLQLYYFIITVYFNIMYIVRSISLSILIATAPIFIASIAFQTKSKDLFETWIRMLVSNIFIQAFHGFILSFFLSIQMSTTRGLELAVIAAGLIPASQIFKQLITKSNGGFMDNAGVAGLAMAGSLIGGASGGKRGSSDYKGSMEEEESSFNMKRDGISEQVPSLASTSATFDSVKTPATSDIGTMTNKASNNFNKLKEGGTQSGNKEITNRGKMDNQKSNKVFKNSSSIQKGDGVKMGKSALKATKNAGVGAAKMTAAAAVGMALGGVDGGRAASSIARSGASDIKSATSTVGEAFNEYGKKGINSLNNNISNIHGKADDANKNIVGAEKLENGNIAIHRSREGLENAGLKETAMSEDNEKLQLTYDTRKLSDEDSGNVENITNQYANGNKDMLRAEGIDNVYETEDGMTTIEYNRAGIDKLGYEKSYTTDSRIIETKRPNQPLESNLTYGVSGVSTKSTKGFTDGEVTGRNLNPQTSSEVRYADDVFEGPTDGGVSQYSKGGSSYNSNSGGGQNKVDVKTKSEARPTNGGTSQYSKGNSSYSHRPQKTYNDYEGRNNKKDSNLSMDDKF